MGFGKQVCLTFIILQIPLRATPHQVTYFSEQNLYPVIVSVPVSSYILNCAMHMNAKKDILFSEFIELVKGRKLLEI